MRINDSAVWFPDYPPILLALFHHLVSLGFLVASIAIVNSNLLFITSNDFRSISEGLTSGRCR